jgi:prepilin signal peptidase PulO-like enzyme (type II secretory pathway)
VTPAALAFTVVTAGVFGLVIGSFLNVVVYRVPAGIPLTRESRCPRCGAPVRPWQNVPVLSWLALRGRCASCDAPISPRYPLVEVATGLAFALLAWAMTDAVTTASAATSGLDSQWAVVPVAVAYFYLAATSVALTLIDLDTHRLPNTIVLPSYVVLLALFAVACVLGADWAALLRATLAGVALYAFYLVLRLVRPGGMGGGDVKLAGVLGIALGWIGWGAVVVGAFAAFLLGGVFGLALLATRRAGRKTAIPFGPWMIAGAWIGILAGESIAGWYVGLFLAG